VKNAKGFTLIEVMIVVAIVAILAAVAVPSYKNSIQKTRRAEAKEALARVAAAQERFFFTNNRYGSAAELSLGATTENGHYTVLVNLGNCSGSGASTRCVSFTLNATAAGVQASDYDCQIFVLDHVGRKSATKAGGGAATAKCW
jgi:type IV pilus assembly protein PilE